MHRFRLWIGNSVLDNSLEYKSSLCEFVGYRMRPNIMGINRLAVSEGMKIRLCHSQEVSFETKYTSNASVFSEFRENPKFRERQFLIARYTKLRYILLQLFQLINILKITKKIQGHTRHAIELLHPSFNLPTRLFCLQNCTGHLYSSQQ